MPVLIRHPMSAILPLRRLLVGVALLLSLTGATAADNWPAWRGAEMTGQCKERNLPVRWSAVDNVRWKVPLPGPGMSSPVVWGDRIFLTQALDKEGTRRALLCFDRKDGRQLWQRVVEYAGKESTYSGEPHYCSASPVTDGGRVIASFGSSGVLCCDFQGKELWRRDLGKCEQIWGNASSPILYRDLVILNFGPGDRTFLIALNKRTGKELWKVEEPGGRYGTAPSEWIGSWSTPVVLRVKDHDELIMTWPDSVKAYDPRTGRLLWRCAGLSRLVYTSPLVTPEVVVAMAGFGGSYLAVKPGGRGDVTAANRLWWVERSTQRVGSGVIVGEQVYIVNANGIAECIELGTGKTLWAERAGGSAWGSMVHADGKLYVTTQQGETVVLAAGPVFEVISRNALGERSQSSPAFSNGEIFIRTYQHLWCIGRAPHE